MSDIQKRVKDAMKLIEAKPTNAQAVFAYASETVHLIGNEEAFEGMSVFARLVDGESDIMGAKFKAAFEKVTVAAQKTAENALDLSTFVTAADDILEKYDERYIPRAEQTMIDKPSPAAQRRLYELKKCRQYFSERRECLQEAEKMAIETVQMNDQFIDVMNQYRNRL